jgi:hypothetical protein
MFKDAIRLTDCEEELSWDDGSPLACVAFHIVAASLALDMDLDRGTHAAVPGYRSRVSGALTIAPMYSVPVANYEIR